MKKEQFLELFDDDDKLRESKASAFLKFMCFRNSYTSQELRVVLNTLIEAKRLAEVEALSEIAARPRVQISNIKMINAKRRKLAKAPGYGVMRMLRLVCSRRFVERELQQTHADALHELYEAEKAGNKELSLAIPWRLRIQLLAVAASGVLGWCFSKMRWRIGGEGD